jgi:hypothetical protein
MPCISFRRLFTRRAASGKGGVVAVTIEDPEKKPGATSAMTSATQSTPLSALSTTYPVSAPSSSAVVQPLPPMNSAHELNDADLKHIQKRQQGKQAQAQAQAAEEARRKENIKELHRRLAAAERYRLEQERRIALGEIQPEMNGPHGGCG